MIFFRLLLVFLKPRNFFSPLKHQKTVVSY